VTWEGGDDVDGLLTASSELDASLQMYIHTFVCVAEKETRRERERASERDRTCTCARVYAYVCACVCVCAHRYDYVFCALHDVRGSVLGCNNGLGGFLKNLVTFQESKLLEFN